MIPHLTQSPGLVQVAHRFAEALNGLTELQVRFVAAYLACGDGTRAAEMAGYEGRTRHVLTARGTKNLRHEGIAAAIESGKAVREALLGGAPQEPEEDAPPPEPLVLPDDPEEAIRVLVTRGGMHSTAQLDGLKYLDARQRERKKAEQLAAPLERLTGMVHARVKEALQRELSEGRCRSCRRPLDSRRALDSSTTDHGPAGAAEEDVQQAPEPDIPGDVIFMRGVSGSGKSTWVARTHPTATVVSNDHHMLNERGEYEFSKARVPAAIAACRAEFEEALDRRDPLVIVDNMHLYRNTYEGLAELAQRRGYRVWQKNMTGEYPNVHGTPETLVRQMRHWYQADRRLPEWRFD